MSDGITKGELIPKSSEPIPENVYRVKPADADDSRNAREQFRDELKEKNQEKSPDQKAPEKVIPGDIVPMSRNWEAIRDDVILSPPAQQLVAPPAAAMEKPATEGDSKPPHIHLTA